MLIRFFDITLALLGLIILLPLFLVLLTIVSLDSRSPIFGQLRLGRNRELFRIYKFRSMLIETPDQPTHLVPETQITQVGKWLRYTKLDELPQIWNVLVGDMSLVGPRPGLPSHCDLISAREKLNVFRVRPGITGLSQLLGVDMSDPARLAGFDAKMITKLNVLSYFGYIAVTLATVFRIRRFRNYLLNKINF